MTADDKLITTYNAIVPEDRLALCGNGHGYDGFAQERCPACGTEARLFVAQALERAGQRYRVLLSSLLAEEDLSWTGRTAREWRRRIEEELMK